MTLSQFQIQIIRFIAGILQISSTILLIIYIYNPDFLPSYSIYIIGVGGLAALKGIFLPEKEESLRNFEYFAASAGLCVFVFVLYVTVVI